MCNITTQENKELARHIPRGFEEGISKDDLIMPRIKIVQAMSNESSVIKQGIIINNLTLEEMPKNFIPILKFTEWRKFNPRSNKDPNFDPTYPVGALIWTVKDSSDARILEAEFGNNGEKPTAIKFMNFLCVFEGQRNPVVISFHNTSYKAGKKLLSLCVNNSMSQGRDMFSNKYQLESKEVSNDSGKFFVFEITSAGRSSDEEYQLSEKIYNDLNKRSKEIKINDDDQTTWEN